MQLKAGHGGLRSVTRDMARVKGGVRARNCPGAPALARRNARFDSDPRLHTINSLDKTSEPKSRLERPEIAKNHLSFPKNRRY